MGFLKSALVIFGVGAAAIVGGVYFGAVHPGADEPHSAVVFKLIETARDRAIAVRAQGIVVPSLDGEEKLRSGAGNYAAMCTGCHLAPGMAPTELSQGLYPAAPALASLGAPDPARAFWVIKHGVKGSGMPAWGKSMSDGYIWSMVAFLQALPDLSPEQYRALVASSGGHAHGGGESMPHDDVMPGRADDHHAQDQAAGHGHDDPAAPAAHDDSGAALHGHGVTHDDTGTAPHGHGPGTSDDPARPTSAATTATEDGHAGHDH